MAPRGRGPLWGGAAVTALAAVLFPRLEAVKNEGVALWELDAEALVLAPLIVVLTLVLFAVLGGWSWRADDRDNRPAKAALACAILGIGAILAFFISAPIVLGGLAITLGVEGRRRAGAQGAAGQALAAMLLGAVAVAIGAGAWLFASG